MGFRFQKRIRIFKGLTLNLSKSRTSWTLCGKGASINVRGDKVTCNAGIPGGGIPCRSDWTRTTMRALRQDVAFRLDGWSFAVSQLIAKVGFLTAIKLMKMKICVPKAGHSGRLGGSQKN